MVGVLLELFLGGTRFPIRGLKVDSERTAAHPSRRTSSNLNLGGVSILEFAKHSVNFLAQRFLSFWASGGNYHP